MTGIIYQEIPRFYTALAEWAACIVYLQLIKGRFSKTHTILLSFLFLILQSVFLTGTGNLPIMFWVPCMIGAAGLMWLFLYCCGDFNALEAVYCCARAFLLAEFTASLEWQMHVFFFRQTRKFVIGQAILLVGIYMLLLFAYWKIEKEQLTKEYLSQVTIKEVLSAVGIAAVIFAFSNLSYVFKQSPFTSQLKTDIMIIRTVVDFGGMAILYAFQSRVCEYIKEKELTSIHAALQSQYDQYRNYQQSLEMIQIKYHDLKHQIAGLRAENNAEKRTEWLNTMEAELDIWKSVGRTGNHVLDTILSAKSIQCRKHRIRFTCVADGTLLEDIHVTDICTIFGNALDNAIEHVVMVPEEDKRLIHLSVSAKHRFTVIKVENYCMAPIKQKNRQLPETTKQDKKNHGFGLKSIRCAAEKYGGSMALNMEKEWFGLTVLLPQKI